MSSTKLTQQHPTDGAAVKADTIGPAIVPTVVFLDVDVPHGRASSRQVRGILTWHGPQMLIDSATSRVVDRDGSRPVVPA